MKRIALAAALVLALAGVAGCGSDSDSSTSSPAKFKRPYANDAVAPLPAIGQQALNQLQQQLPRLAQQVPPRFEDLVSSMGEQIQAIKDQLRRGDGNVSVDAMFRLQFQMQTVSQYIEAASSILSAIHQSAMSMARAVKGQ